MSLKLTALSLSIVCLLAWAKVADSAGSETLLLSSVAFDSGSGNGLLKSSSFEACELFTEPADLLHWKLETQRDERQVSARFFGRPQANLSDFKVTEDCQGIRLRNYRSQQVYTGPAPNGCVVAFRSEDQYFTFVVSITGTPDIWALSLPLNDSLVITKASCQSTDIKNCALAHNPPCQNQTLNSFATDKKSAACTECVAGAKADETMNGSALLYGLRATYFKLEGCQKKHTSQAPRKAPDLTALQPDPETPPRCQDALSYQVELCWTGEVQDCAQGACNCQEKAPSAADVSCASQAYNSTWKTVPPLPAKSYTGCFGAELDGYVSMTQPKTAGKSKHSQPANMPNLHRVCVRYNAAVSVKITGKSLVVAAPSPDFDLLLSCVDANISAGLKPIVVQYVSSTGSADAVLQLFITPASTGRGQGGAAITYNCTICPLFGRQATGCCTPLTTKDFRTATCSSALPYQQSGQQTTGSPIISARAPARARPAASPTMRDVTPHAGVLPSRQLRPPQRAPAIPREGKACKPEQRPGPNRAPKNAPRPARSWGPVGHPRAGANLTSQPAQAPKQPAPRRAPTVQSKPLNSRAPGSSEAATGNSRAPVLAPQSVDSGPSKSARNDPGTGSSSPRATERQCRNNGGPKCSGSAHGCPTSAAELYGWSTVAPMPYMAGVSPSALVPANPANGLTPQPSAGASTNANAGTVSSGSQLPTPAVAPSPVEGFVSWTDLVRMAADNATSCADLKKAIFRAIDLT